MKPAASIALSIVVPLYNEELNVVPLFDELTSVADASGHDGDIRWNFEKWLVSPERKVVARYSPQMEPDDPSLVADIEAQLP